jgi:HD-GYP domain-containing protein (c-di-GMP phosphodiesterase class II)
MVGFVSAFTIAEPRNLVILAAVVAMSALAETLAIELARGGKVSISASGIVVAAIQCGPAGAAVTATVVALVNAIHVGGSRKKLLFNFGQLNIAAFLASICFFLIEPEPQPSAMWLLFGAAIGLVHYSTSTVAVSVVLGLTTAQTLRDSIKSFVWVLPHYLGLAIVGGGMALAFAELGPFVTLLLGVPLALTRYSMQQVVDRTREHLASVERSNAELNSAYVQIRDMSQELSQAYTGTLESLVTALDVRDQETRGHSVRVASHSIEIARAIGISDADELATIYRGALMHDVGKIGVPDGVLLKPGQLTEDEWKLMRRHPALGYRILAQVPYLRPTARIVLAHHERWDGKGYPRGTAGEDIPLGARIFAICDTYDAILSDRPYRAGQSPEAALAEILRCGGTQFDPHLVEAFEALFPRWAEEDPRKTPRPLYLPSWQEHDATLIERRAS